MPIEFHCSGCQTLLRVADDTAGRQTRCPHCSAINRIPGGESEPPADESPEDEFRIQPFSQAPRPSSDDPANPYASPTFTTAASGDFARQESPFERTGPPWERDGASANSYIQTVTGVFSNPERTFSRMRVRGGIGAPLLFAVIGGTIPGVIGTMFNMGIQFALEGAVGGLPVEEAAFGMVGMVCVLLLFPVFIIIGTFINAGIIHICLLALGGGKYDFEATFRTVCYTSGTTSWIWLIPMCGQYIQGIVQIVYEIIALSKAQEISGGRAAGAVLLPIAVCCGLGLLAVFFIMFAVAAAI